MFSLITRDFLNDMINTDIVRFLNDDLYHVSNEDIDERIIEKVYLFKNELDYDFVPEVAVRVWRV